MVIKLTDLVAQNGYGFQKDNTNYLVQLPDAEYFGAILNGAVNASIR